MTQLPGEPMLAAPTASPRLPTGWAAEPKWDGFRSLLARGAGGRVQLVSRRGRSLAESFPEIVDAALALPAGLGDVAFDGELVIWNEGRLDFKLLLKRQGRRRAAVRTLAARHPAHYVAFDLLYLGDRSLLREPYLVRRRELERLFAEFALTPPWTLCPSTTDPAEAALWLTAWTGLGIEGICFKALHEPYLPGRRAWRKYRVRDSIEVVIGAITGTPEHPDTLLVGLPGPDRQLRFLGRTVPLHAPAAAELAPELAGAGPAHPWRDQLLTRAFEPGAAYPVTLVDPNTVVEVSAPATVDSAGRWRQPARFLRTRPDLTPAELQPVADG
ncbi:ATP-dependent DNA ligase [Actinocrinis puniceicyclus]|uniref:ATP-dependent DNA ligase n=1 Tax=Actinocrinis puniceicyclus TaxID=977794 RepID=A0A8J7WJT2_9ACTN|nr:ATP-dependent DNA ligase [Actinocrinis puniceicyclus]MBS2961437.1 ATP-dependent DNA ligase [Actinocrinis puniceicyclus]